MNRDEELIELLDSICGCDPESRFVCPDCSNQWRGEQGKTLGNVTKSMKSENLGSMTVKKISSVGNSCNFCNKPNSQGTVLEVKGEGLSVRFCTACFQNMVAQGNK